LSDENFAGNIIINLASLPDFLRTPILKKRMMEFFSMSDLEKAEIINNALEAGPSIPFPNFSKLFKTWLEVLCSVTEENRYDMFSNYFRQIIKKPENIIIFNLDGIFGVFSSLDDSKQKILSKSIQSVFERLDEESKRVLVLLTPKIARNVIGF
jgi:type I restriction-modification system DNA methylase subunit|tara:strand:- start:137 stop:598 length:462 start_codon:yes stop_codon:yes gene_type:complete